MVEAATHRLFCGIDGAFFGDSRERRVHITQLGPQPGNADRIYGRFEELGDGSWGCNVSESGESDLRNTLEGLSMRLLNRDLAHELYTKPGVTERIGQVWSIHLKAFPQLSFYAMPEGRKVVSEIRMSTRFVDPNEHGFGNEILICRASGDNMYDSVRRLDSVEVSRDAIKLMLEGSAYNGAGKAIQRSYEDL